MKKRYLSIALALILTIGLLPFSALAAAVGELQADALPDWVTETDMAAVTAAFEAEYEKMGGQAVLGEAADSVQSWDGLVVRQWYAGGSTTSAPFGVENSCFIMLNAADGQAAVLRNGFLNYWMDNGYWDGVGYPISGEFIREDGTVVQAFSASVLAQGGDTVTAMPNPIGAIADGYPDAGPWLSVKDAVTRSFIAAYQEAYNNGFTLGAPHETVKPWGDTGVFYQAFMEGDNDAGPVWGLKEAFILQGSPSKPAYAVYGEMLKVWYGAEVGNNFAGAGFPIGAQFTVDGTVYQNFSNGYIAIADGAGRLVADKSVDTAGAEKDLAAGLAPGELDAEGIPVWAADKREYLGSAIELAYAQSAAAGYSLGEPVAAGFDGEGYAVVQEFTGGSIPAGQTAAIMVTNDVNAAAFVLSGAVYRFWQDNGGFGGVGYPMSPAFTYEGKEYQVFRHMTLVIDGNSIGSLPLAPAKLGDGFPASGDWATSYGQTRVDELFVSVYKQASFAGTPLGVPDGGVTAQGGTEGVVQEFNGGENAIVMAQPIKKAWALQGEIYTAWKGQANAGFPVAAQVVTEAMTYQNLEKGYIKVENGSASFVADKNLNSALEDVEAGMPPDVGLIKTLPASYSDLTDDQRRQLTQAFREEYANQLAMGYNPGEAEDEYIHDWGGTINQNFNSGDGTSSAYGRTGLSMLFANLEGDVFKVYTVKNEMASGMASMSGAIGDTGVPLGNEFEYGGKLYQNFQNGCMIATPDDHTKIDFKTGESITLEQLEQADSSGAPETAAPAPDGETTGGFPWWGFLLIGLGVAAAAVIVVVILKKKKG